MQPPHEGMPHGVPKSYDWATQPRVGSNNPKKFTATINRVKASTELKDSSSLCIALLIQR
ncbi:hypothetical protein NIES2098_71410 [Calothrix sp. NIES-2098]|nr:hypothetical protein NIES2098_71410 [Calothrix sp. NIES-2098]